MRPSSIWVRGVARLGPNSGALGRGLSGSNTLVPDDDIDGDARPSGAVDVGCDERGGTSPFD